MKLLTREVEGVTVIALEGSVLGGPDATALNNELHKLVDKHKKKVVVDMSGVQSMNSSGLAMLIEAMKTMKDAKGDLKIAAATEKIQSLMAMTKLTTIFELYPTVKKAVASFAP
ncbi:MAG: STAS domain-containing protein [Bacteroidota bacterium]|jgi:anti-sigma B factor antagonist